MKGLMLASKTAWVEYDTGVAEGVELTVVHGFEIIDEGKYVLVTHGNALEDGNFVADLHA